MRAWFAGSIRSLNAEHMAMSHVHPQSQSLLFIACLQISLEFLSAKGMKSHIRCAQPSTFKSVILKQMDIEEEKTHRKTLHTYKAPRM